MTVPLRVARSIFCSSPWPNPDTYMYLLSGVMYRPRGVVITGMTRLTLPVATSISETSLLFQLDA